MVLREVGRWGYVYYYFAVYLFDPEQHINTASENAMRIPTPLGTTTVSRKSRKRSVHRSSPQWVGGL